MGRDPDRWHGRSIIIACDSIRRGRSRSSGLENGGVGRSGAECWVEWGVGQGQGEGGREGDRHLPLISGKINPKGNPIKWR